MKTARDDGRRVEGHSDDRDRANREGKFARARAQWEGRAGRKSCGDDGGGGDSGKPKIQSLRAAT